MSKIKLIIGLVLLIYLIPAIYCLSGGGTLESNGISITVTIGNTSTPGPPYLPTSNYSYDNGINITATIDSAEFPYGSTTSDDGIEIESTLGTGTAELSFSSTAMDEGITIDVTLGSGRTVPFNSTASSNGISINAEINDFEFPSASTSCDEGICINAEIDRTCPPPCGSFPFESTAGDEGITVGITLDSVLIPYFSTGADEGITINSMIKKGNLSCNTVAQDEGINIEAELYSTLNECYGLSGGYTPPSFSTLLLLYDDVNDSECINTNISFYANYTEVQGTHIPGANCNITFTQAPSGPFAMIESSINYYYKRLFTTAGTQYWNVSCTFDGFYGCDYEDAFGNSSTNISDCSIANLTINASDVCCNDVIQIKANYTNSSSGEHISGAVCNATFDNDVTVILIDNGNYYFNDTNEYACGIQSTGEYVHYYNVSCYNESYGLKEANGTFIVAVGKIGEIWDCPHYGPEESIPEFNIIGILLILIISSIAYITIVNEKRYIRKK